MSDLHQPTLEQVKKLSAQGNLIPVYRELRADLETSVSAYLKIATPEPGHPPGKYSFLLESIEGGERIARYSFMGADPYKVIVTGARPAPERARRRPEPVHTEQAQVIYAGSVDPLTLIQKELGQNRPVRIEGLPRFLEGAVGYLGYEAVRYFEKLPAPAGDPQGLPESIFMFTDTIVVFDHLQHKIKVVSHVHTDGNIEREYEKATARIDELVQRLTEPFDIRGERLTFDF